MIQTRRTKPVDLQAAQKEAADRKHDDRRGCVCQSDGAVVDELSSGEVDAWWGSFPGRCPGSSGGKTGTHTGGIRHAIKSNRPFGCYTRVSTHRTLNRLVRTSQRANRSALIRIKTDHPNRLARFRKNHANLLGQIPSKKTKHSLRQLMQISIVFTTAVVSILWGGTQLRKRVAEHIDDTATQEVHRSEPTSV